jgi:hypothetical protein
VVTDVRADGFDAARQLAIARRALARRSFCVLATVSRAGVPHAVGLLYEAVGTRLYVLVGEDSVKARNVRQNPRVAVSVPVRRFPFGPPMAVQFQGRGRLLRADEEPVRSLLARGRLRRITGLGAGSQPGTCFLELTPAGRISTYGLGMPLHTLLRNVSQGHRSVALPPAAVRGSTV